MMTRQRWKGAFQPSSPRPKPINTPYRLTQWPWPVISPGVSEWGMQISSERVKERAKQVQSVFPYLGRYIWLAGCKHSGRTGRNTWTNGFVGVCCKRAKQKKLPDHVVQSRLFLRPHRPAGRWHMQMMHIAADIAVDDFHVHAGRNGNPRSYVRELLQFEGYSSGQKR